MTGARLSQKRAVRSIWRMPVEFEVRGIHGMTGTQSVVKAITSGERQLIFEMRDGVAGIKLSPGRRSDTGRKCHTCG